MGHSSGHVTNGREKTGDAGAEEKLGRSSVSGRATAEDGNGDVVNGEDATESRLELYPFTRSCNLSELAPCSHSQHTILLRRVKLVIECTLVRRLSACDDATCNGGTS